MMFWLLVFAMWAGVARRRWLADERRRRHECRRFGHVPYDDRRGAPVCELTVCGRCGQMLESLSSWRVR